MPQNGPRNSVLRFLRPAASGLRGWGGGRSSPTRRIIAGADRALETRGRLAYGPDGLIPAIKIASATCSPLRRVGVLSAGADSATTSAARTWCPALRGRLRSSTTTTATPTRCSTCPPPPRARLHGRRPSSARRRRPCSTCRSPRTALGACPTVRRPRWPPRDPRPP